MTQTTTSKLGRATVNRIGFGAMQLAGRGVFGPPRDRGEAIAVLRRAVELGVNHIDTAQYYGPDVVNELIREALHPYPEGLQLVSKVGARRDERGAWLAAQRPEELRAGVEDNLRSLGIERLALINLRLLEEESSEVPLEDQLGALDELRQEGKVENIGVSNVSREVVERAMRVTDIAGVQNGYSLLDRRQDDLVELCRAEGLAFVPFFPLGSAFTGGPARLAADPAVAEVASRRGATPAQVAMAWLLHRGEHILLIPGTASVAHLEENMAAADVSLDADDLAALDAVTPTGDPLQSVSRPAQ